MQHAPAYPVSIFLAGDLAQAKHVCREWCFEVGGCVTVTPTTYVYTGGEEEGFVVGFINYPRFPTEPEVLLKRAEDLADRLMHRLFQHSYTIQTPGNTFWISRRPEDTREAR